MAGVRSKEGVQASHSRSRFGIGREDSAVDSDIHSRVKQKQPFPLPSFSRTLENSSRTLENSSSSLQKRTCERGPVHSSVSSDRDLDASRPAVAGQHVNRLEERVVD